MDPLDDGTVEQTESADVEVEDNDGDEVEDDGPAANFKGRHYGFAVNHLDLSDSEDSPDVDFMILAALRSTHTRSYSDDEPSEPDDSDSDGQIPYATASDQAGKEARVGRLACSLLNQRTRAPGNTPLTNAIFDAIFPGLDSPEPRARWRKTASRDRSSERNSGDIQRTEMDLSARRIGSRLASGSSSGLSSAPPTAALDCTFMELQLDATNATSSESERNNRKTRPTELVLAKRRISSGLRTGSSSGLSSAPPTAALELTFGEFQLARSSSSDDVQPNDGDIRRTELELPRRKISSGLASGSSSDLSPPPPTAALELTFTELQLASPNKAERSNKDIQRTNLSLNERKHKGALASDSSSGLSSSPPTAALQHTFADLQLGGLEGGSGHGNYLRTRNRSSTK